MTPKQILDSFAETLMWDERVLSAQERSLLVALLHHAKAASGQTPETQEAVRGVIASAVGETVAQRAFSVLGGSIVEKILEGSAVASTASRNLQNGEIYATEPQPPKPGPPGPGVKAPPQPSPAPVSPTPPSEPQPPRPGPPGPGAKQLLPMRDIPAPTAQLQPTHGALDTCAVAERTIAVAERPPLLPARCVVLDEFLVPQEVEQLTRFTLAHETDFQISEVISPVRDGGVVNHEHRRSRVLMDIGRQHDLVRERIRAPLPEILRKLGMEEFSIAEIETQITASNDGDFFRFHSDNGSESVSSRYLTFVYFFHREPAQFEGGELRLYDARLKDGVYVGQGSYHTIVPRQNQIVFFPCELMHEITPVKCPSGRFADSRFTLNGWLRR